jgi:Myristoyl-CoA:protein N-myristoyltransferase, C-terminal domain
MTMARTIKLYKLSEETATPGIRPMQQSDVPQVPSLLATHCQSRSGDSRCLASNSRL